MERALLTVITARILGSFDNTFASRVSTQYISSTVGESCPPVIWQLQMPDEPSSPQARLPMPVPFSEQLPCPFPQKWAIISYKYPQPDFSQHGYKMVSHPSTELLDQMLCLMIYHLKVNSHIRIADEGDILCRMMAHLRCSCDATADTDKSNIVLEALHQPWSRRSFLWIRSRLVSMQMVSLPHFCKTCGNTTRSPEPQYRSQIN